MGWVKKSLLVADFLIFFVASFLFIILNNEDSYFLSQFTGLLSIPLVLLFFKGELVQDFRSPIIPLAILMSSFIVLVFYFSITDPSWVSVLPTILIAPVLIEEFNFRYVLQRIFLRKMSPYSAVFVQGIFYVGFYSKYVIADHGLGFPFPYNLLMLSSVLGMGLVYGLLAKFTKNFLLSTSLHFILWGLFPVIAHYPGIASTLLPT
ncbi:MAG: CPBP family intramembrane metalloprotease [Thermoplasmatales archaeon]|jgi:membrane protease YdiL (CAAX protease family)|nr:CPBP family intramembrane metalloprotease [Candidatus Thermoplasmatota archaeon]MCL6002054.1 CPBP family intramembrane metalloprotease [Candidatus Thermoplasmatota archaeon]MDA8054627.1 CPBP family intramembrane metalloprotease [Thermoplasmatales archaeon]